MAVACSDLSSDGSDLLEDRGEVFKFRSCPCLHTMSVYCQQFPLMPCNVYMLEGSGELLQHFDHPFFLFGRDLHDQK
jgi:hypothetical protein